MNQENRNSSNRSSVSRRSRGGASSILLIVTLMGLTALVTYLIVKKNETTRQEKIVETKDAEIGEIVSKMETLEQELDAKIQEARRLGASYKELQEYKDQLEIEKATLMRSNQMSETQARQYLARIQQYENLISAKDKELTQLRAEKAALTQERDELTEVKDSLLNTQQELTVSLEEASEDNRKLTSQASVLRADNIAIRAFNKRDKEEARNVFRSKKIEKLQINFIIARNTVAEAGNRKIYMRLLEPNGALVYNTAIGSGQFERNGSSTQYTIGSQILYANNAQPVRLEYDRPDDYKFKQGTYTIELYADGEQIGHKSFEVK